MVTNHFKNHGTIDYTCCPFGGVISHILFDKLSKYQHPLGKRWISIKQLDNLDGISCNRSDTVIVLKYKN